MSIVLSNSVSLTSKPMKIAIACGGTGGHLFPGLAVAEQLRRRGHETLLLISPKQIDALALKSAPNEKAQPLPGIGWPGLLSLKMFSFSWQLVRNWKECTKIYRQFNPNAVLGMGGFTSAVPLLLGRRLRLPTFIHESNAIPGRVTRMIAPYVSKTLLGFGSCGVYLRQATCVVTGTPLRPGMQRVDRAEAAEKLGLFPDRKVVLIVGGSQGAHPVNQLILKALPLWAVPEHREKIQFIHLTGQADEKLVHINYNRQQKLKAIVQAFSSDMNLYYSVADLVIARSGAATLTELSHYGLPSILIPYPTAADDHQWYNARIFEQSGAARLCVESKLTPELLFEEVQKILTQPDLHEDMSEAAYKLAHNDAAKRVAEEIESVCNRT
jgi:UDP-N-acetylglucosamine--N-acetylmuramyl-(pentapeptide) pyrophosphoryl-undecaprenol N-acetylglucosamine transferase